MMETAKEKKISPFEKRIHEIDFLRGFLMCLVIMDHLFYLLATYNGMWMGADAIEPFNTIHAIFNWYWTSMARRVVRYCALGAFCFVSGVSSAFSRNNWKRALEMVGLWAIIFIGSNILDGLYAQSGLNLGLNSIRIDFNIIGVLAFSTLLYCFFQDKKWQWLLVIAGIGLTIHIGLQIIWLNNPSFGEDIYCPLLWKPSDFVAKQADYMPLIPYISFFFLGALLTKFTYGKERKSYFKRHEFERPICFLGRHSLIIYITHYAILVGLFALINVIVEAVR